MSSNVFPSTKTRLLLGPLRQPQLPANPYQPVDCDFTDDLEFVSIKKILVEVKFWNAEAKIAESETSAPEVKDGLKTIWQEIRKR